MICVQPQGFGDSRLGQYNQSCLTFNLVKYKYYTLNGHTEVITVCFTESKVMF